MHQLLLPGVRLHALALHPVQGGLGLVQDQDTSGQAEMLQIYLKMHGSWFLITNFNRKTNEKNIVMYCIVLYCMVLLLIIPNFYNNLTC